MILQYLSEKKVVRFSEIKRILTTISGTVLSERLIELEKEGLVTKKIYSEIPPKVEYRLTDRGKELESIMNELKKWYFRWMEHGR
jgi:DNA-binding HxlR family transcriptional regulator